MLLVPCPQCGLRNASEFRYVGEPSPRPAPATATPPVWRRYLYLRRNVAGWQRESWYHRAGCRRFFSVERHTVTNEIRRLSDDAVLVDGGPLADPPAGDATAADLHEGAP